jgi:LPXTG-site transpeptidase (sortase) family protein
VLTVLPSEVWVLNHTSEETLTLITCVPIGIYSHRLIVRATPVE